MESRARKHGCRFSTDYTYRGMRCLTLENEELRLVYLLDKGADLIELRYKPMDLDFMYTSPNGATRPSEYVPSVASASGNYLDLWPGGWQEVFPAGGLPATYRGAEHGIHGEVALLPWDFELIRDDAECVSVRLSVRTRRTPFLLVRTVTVVRQEPYILLEESVTNEGSVALHAMWGHHPCFGSPFLDDSCVIDAPAATVVTPESPVFPVGRARPGRWSWPSVPAVDGGEVDLSRVLPHSARIEEGAYLTDFSSGWCTLTNQRLKVGIALTWSQDVFPWMWLWLNYGGQLEAPSYGRVYTVALEPFTSYPNDLTSAIAAGSAMLLNPAQTVSARLSASIFRGLSRVGDVREGGRSVTGTS